MIDRPLLERRTKTLLEQGPETPEAVSASIDIESQPPIDLPVGMVLAATTRVGVRAIAYLTGSSDATTAWLKEGDLVRITRPSSRDASAVTVEPVNYAGFEQSFIPGGIRGHESYQGYDIAIEWATLARDFVVIREADEDG